MVSPHTKRLLSCGADSGEDSTNWSIWDRRFAEMDWNHNGTIHFNEFLMAFESWVGVDDDDEDDDDIDEGDETRHETEKETSTAVEFSVH
ncbi:unnamed protein product [Phytophthora lilii]|uniref:Unnamed protein product n=1 Tax=Phytophthora lilii TaxID=2077276 RepID=A0A9W6WS05_9STRA|nr:unnamed protein product [Phytophthora lilii]